MFVDEADIEVIAGKGGDGSASFRREKYVPKGGPDGGDGGDGGDIFIRVKENIHGLASLAATRRYTAENGQSGRGKQQHGAEGGDVHIDVAPGTVISELIEDRSREVVDTATLESGALYRIAKGGKGGLGNVHFATSTHQTPREFTPGTRGEHKRLKLVVRHIADVGLVGLPNVGKSTFLARVSAARPKVANYPFTTLEPLLGVVEVGSSRFVIADIPGLIEGASRGKGLGHKFLRHLARTKVLLHLIDAQSQTPLADYAAIRTELEAYDPTLLRRPEVIAVSRADTLDDKAQRRLWHQLHAQLGPVIFLSSQSGRGVDDVLRALAESIRSDRGVNSRSDRVTVE